MKQLLILMLCLLLAVTGLAAAEPVTVTGHVTEVEKYGHACLDITIDAFQEAGFALGDIITVEAGSYSGDMPFFNGYYVDRGEPMVRAYPGQEFIALCINYGKFAETAGIGVGDPVKLTLKEKAGALSVQEVNNLVYTDNRADYASDEVFANFRPVTAGNVAEGRLYRSASPVNNSRGRAAIASALAEKAGIRSVLNLANTEEEVAAFFAEDGFASDFYRELYDAGHVACLGMAADFASEDFAEKLAKGISFLAHEEPPFLVHCNEGKDRAGFTSMILEALMGAGTEEIEADYMLSFANYYGTAPGTAQYETVLEKNIREMMRVIAGLEKGASLENVDICAAAENWLLSAGVPREDLDMLKDKLGGQAIGAAGKTAQDLIEELVVCYGAHGAQADAAVNSLLEELSAQNAQLGEKWTAVLDLWRSVQSPDLPIHEGILPDGLAQTDELCLVVLGFQLNPDGSMKDELVERLKVAKASAEKYPNAYIVCTGGGTASENPEATESGRMAQWLVDNGIAENRVLVEDRSLTTAQNAIYTFELLKEKCPQVKELAIISSDYHIATGMLLFGAEAVLTEEPLTVVSNAAWPAPSGELSSMFQAGALIELSGDVETAFEIYYDTYDIHELPGAA